MTDLLATLVGTGLAGLRQACSVGDQRLAYDILRAAAELGESTPPATAPVDQQWPPIWYAVTRMNEVELASTVPGPPAMPALLDALHYLRDPVSIVVSRVQGQIEVHVGLSSHDTAAWAQRVLAPDMLLATTAAPASCSHRAWLAVRSRPAPAAGQLPRDRSGPIVTLLDRLTAVEEGSWAIRLQCTPAPSRELEEAIADLIEMSAAAAATSQITTMLDEVTHAQRTDPAATAVVEWLSMLTDDLERMAAGGGWRTQTWIHADSQLTAHLLAAALTADGPQDPRQPMRIWFSDVVPVLVRGQGAQPLEGVLSSAQVATWLFPPKSSRGGLSVGGPLPPGRISLPMRREIRLGTWLGTPDLASIDVDDLSGHAFVAGVTGSGKSTTLLRLLLPLWRVHRIPFLIIDPVKEDYRELAGNFDGGLRILQGSQLRLNALRPRPGTDPSVHLDQVGAAFKGAFSMPSPIPYVVSLLLDGIRPLLARGEQLTLHDLRRGVRPLIGKLGYRGELEGNILASLETRLAILTAPHRAERFCADHDNLAELFERPTVVTLADLGDDEERAFVMALLMIYVAQDARRHGSHPQVRHVTVIEEAHRLVGQPSEPGSQADSGDAAGYAARLVAQLLAEIRSYGESIILLDQSPAAVAREVVRNTNTKILHRILDPSDRELVAGAVGLGQSEADFLADLGPGQALVAHVRLPRPQLMQVAPAPPSLSAGVLEPLPPVGRPCCGTDPVRHHQAQQSATEATQIVVVMLTGCLVRSARDRSSVTLFAAQQLGQLAARVGLPDAACLEYIGVRAAVQEWVNAGWLAGSAVAEFTDEVVGCLAAGGTARIELPPVPVPRIRPYQGCDGCGHACLVRPVARAHPELSQIREAVGRRAGADGTAVVESFRERLFLQYQGVLDGPAAEDAARCIVLHALGDRPESAGAI